MIYVPCLIIMVKCQIKCFREEEEKMGCIWLSVIVSTAYLQIKTLLNEWIDDIKL